MADQPTEWKGLDNAPLKARLTGADSIPVPKAEPSPRALRPPSWSRAEVLDRLGGDEELLQELCQIFLKESPRLMEKLRQGMANGDAEAVQRAAHSLKGMGRERDLSAVSEAIRLMERELDELRQAIEDDADGASR